MHLIGIDIINTHDEIYKVVKRHMIKEELYKKNAIMKSIHLKVDTELEENEIKLLNEIYDEEFVTLSDKINYIFCVYFSLCNYNDAKNIFIRL